MVNHAGGLGCQRNTENQDVDQGEHFIKFFRWPELIHVGGAIPGVHIGRQDASLKTCQDFGDTSAIASETGDANGSAS